MSQPTHVGQAVGDLFRQSIGQRPVFLFRSWVQSNPSFEYPTEAGDFLEGCGSVAELYFARAFCQRPGVFYGTDGAARIESLALMLQQKAASYLIDAVVQYHDKQLAVEIDGMHFHHKTAEQVAADYLRQRRIVLKGYTVIRFTAKEVINDPGECWRQVETILSHWNRN